MFQKLQQKWGVNHRQFWIIFIVFGLTGTTTAILTRYVTAWLGMDASSFWVWKLMVRLGMLVFGYQFILLGYGALLGQWAFFWKYEELLLRKLGVLSQKSKIKNQNNSLEPMAKGQQPIPNSQSPIAKGQQPIPKTQLAIFASGAGSNAQKIIEHFKNHPSVRVALVVCNKPGAGVLQIASDNGIPSLLIEKERFFRGDTYLPVLKEYGIDFIVLAGFLWKVPIDLINAYPQKILNIHPALLPKYGGKGMYGMHVHEAVIAAGEKQSGITIHFVNEHFDEGAPVFQATCLIDEKDTPETLAQKIHVLEHAHFPVEIEKIVS